MKVVLPDATELELPEGASGLDAARAIGPKLAEQAVLVRVDGTTRDLRLPLADGERIQILTTRDTHDADALSVLRHSTAHLLAEAVTRLHPGVKIAIGPPIADGFYYDFEFPEPISESDLEAIEDEMRREIADGRTWERQEVPREEAIARFEAEDEPYKVELAQEAEGPISLYTQGAFTDLCRGPHLQSSATDQGRQADGPRGRVLEGRRAQHAADADLRHRVLLAGRPGRAPRAARAGARARPSPARRPARPLPPLGALARIAVLAPQGDGGLERPRGPPPPRERAARLPRGEDAAALRHSDVHHVGSLRQLPGEHVLRPTPRGRGAARAQAHELPRPHAALRLAAALLPRSPASATRSRRRCIATSAAAPSTASSASSTSRRTTHTSS